MEGVEKEGRKGERGGGRQAGRGQKTLQQQSTTYLYVFNA